MNERFAKHVRSFDRTCKYVTLWRQYLYAALMQECCPGATRFKEKYFQAHTIVFTCCWWSYLLKFFSWFCIFCSWLALSCRLSNSMFCFCNCVCICICSTLVLVTTGGGVLFQAGAPLSIENSKFWTRFGHFLAIWHAFTYFLVPF